ncbi:MAG: hypothetical protein AB7K71_16850 [Polyangiaceae bacterium]
MPAKKKTSNKSTPKSVSTSAAKTNGNGAKAAAKNGNGKAKVRWPDAAVSDNAPPLSAEDAYEIGRMISERYQGELSLREIGEQEQLRLSPGALHRCLAVYRVCNNLNTKPTWQHLGFSHLNRLDALTAAQQKKLAGQAEKQRWSVDRIEREVTRLRQTSKKTQRRGRPALPRFAKAAHQLRRFTDGRDDLLGDLDAAASLERDRLKDLQTQVIQVKGQLDKLDQALKRAMKA